MQAAARSNLKRVTLELGGKSPNVVFADADLDAAVEGAHFALFFNQGQCCCAGSRLFVESHVHDEFVDRLHQAHKKQKVGDPFDPEHRRKARRSAKNNSTRSWATSNPASRRRQSPTGGGRVGKQGYFIEPTVFTDVKDEHKIAQEEIFGPVLSVIRFNDIDEVIHRGNRSMYGLAAAVWTNDIGKAHRMAAELKAGTVWINCYDVFDAAAPFGGFKMSRHRPRTGRICPSQLHGGQDGDGRDEVRGCVVRFPARRPQAAAPLLIWEQSYFREGQAHGGTVSKRRI